MLSDARLANLHLFLLHLPAMIRPVLNLTFLLDRHLYGESPAGYHLLNVLLHGANGLLVYAIASRAVSRLEVPRAERFQRLPFWTALLFLLHPIQTETVTYVSGRATGLMSCFYLLAFYLFVRSSEGALPSRRFWAGYVGALFSFVLALLAKEAAVTLPIALLLWCAVFPLPGAQGRRGAWRLHLPFWVLLLLALGAGWAHARYVYLARLSLEIRPLYDNAITQVNAVAYALTLFFLPARLNFDHDLAEFHSFFPWPIPLAALVLGALLAVALAMLRRAPFLAFGILWFFLQILPANSVVPRYDILSERNLYLPAAGIFLALAALGLSAAAQLRAWSPRVALPAFTVGTVLVLAALLVTTVSRNRIYRDPVTFWTDAVRQSPRKARTHNNLGYAYFEAGDLDRSIDEFRAALALDRDLASAQRNLLLVWKIKQSRLGRGVP
jgi:tetratricopeptide (TPR) repeat protein